MLRNMDALFVSLGAAVAAYLIYILSERMLLWLSW